MNLEPSRPIDLDTFVADRHDTAFIQERETTTIALGENVTAEMKHGW